MPEIRQMPRPVGQPLHRWGKPSGVLTDEAVEVLILGRDPNPDIRERQAEFLKFMLIAEWYEKRTSLRRS